MSLSLFKMCRKISESQNLDHHQLPAISVIRQRDHLRFTNAKMKMSRAIQLKACVSEDCFS